MTKGALLSKLDGFISKGYLREQFSGKKVSVFLFLGTVYIGFAHDGSDTDDAQDIKGALLTADEAQILIRSESSDAVAYLCAREELGITFSKKLLAKCRSFFGRAGLKSKIKNNPFLSDSNNNTDWMLSSFPGSIGLVVMKLLFEVKLKIFQRYRRYLRLVKVFGFIALACSLIATGVIVTDDWREQFNEDRPSVAFDKNADANSYSYIEIDMVIPLARLYASHDMYHKENDHGTYYLWGNRDTRSFGVLRFDPAYDWTNIISDDQESVIFEDPVVLYGSTKDMPRELTGIFARPEMTDNYHFISNDTITMPDGSEIFLPDHPILPPESTIPLPSDTLVDDNCDAVRDFFARQGITIDENSALGVKYIVAAAAPEKVNAPLNSFIDALMGVGFGLALILLIPTTVFGYLADKTILRMRSELLLRQIYEKVLPVDIDREFYNIYIRTEAYLAWLEAFGATCNVFECTATFPLADATPAVSLLEDNIKKREYVLQTEGNEDFRGKYFHFSVRLSIIGDPPVPVAQIDGFISDTPVDREMTSDDIGYRMEGYFLALGGESGKRRYEMTWGQDLPMKGLKYLGYTTPSNVRLIGICPVCKRSFCFHGYSFYLTQNDVAYSDDGLDCCVIQPHNIDADTWSYETEGKTFRYYNSFHCPRCAAPYIDYKKHPENKVFGVSGCVHLGRKPYRAD